MENKDKTKFINGEIQQISWDNLSKKKIFFGHQSVGDNIIDGIYKLIKSNGSQKLRISKTNNPDDFEGPIFAHFHIGQNGDPFSKIASFKKCVDNGIGNKANIAFFKFCFWDIRNNTDIHEVFKNYKNTLYELKTKYTKTKFIHVTVPLTYYSKSIKDILKRSIGIKIENDFDNIKRNELNQLILEEYRDKEPIFDLAKIDSNLPNNERVIFHLGKRSYFYLASEYTSDGGHLNERGQKIAAKELINFLSKILEKTN